MASDSFNGESNDKKDRKDEGGLGNLPPLSDFDSSGGFASDSGLPPLSAFDSDKDKAPVGGLPPLSDISIETPKPTLGGDKPTPPGFEVGDFGTPSFETPPKKTKGTGFQDLAADSDFSPETPEIGPGPDADIDTPMFDSAFGGGRGFTPTFETPAPTQAMETPMFGGGAKEPSPFDEGAFKPGSPFEAGGGTPMPDFSPDSTLATRKPGVAPAPPGPAPAPVKAAKGGGGGAKSTLTTVLAAVICLVVGVFAGPFASTKVSFIPNPLTKTIADKDSQIAAKDKQINQMLSVKQGEKMPTKEEIDAKIQELDKLNKDIKAAKDNAKTAEEELNKVSGNLDQVRADLENKNEEFVKAQEAFEDLQNQTAIVNARQMGLVAEVERLTGMVGTLEQANARSVETKDSLLNSVERLSTEIKEGIPLTPDKYNRMNRIQAVEALKAKVEEAKWITPDLLNEYTDLYQKEMAIGASTAYFFAKIPVVDKLGNADQQWAECLMKGNWAVYYRTVDGKHVGSYENTSNEGAAPEYAFRETLPEKVRAEIADEIMASRGPDFEQKIQVIMEKQKIADGSTSGVQRVFSSL